MNKHNGHGSFAKINDQQEFFAAAKKSNRLIVVFTRNSNKWGKQLLEHCEVLAQKHLEARFVWVDAENAPFLTDRLNIYLLPTIVCVKDNKVHKQHNGLNDISGDGKMTTGLIEFLLQTTRCWTRRPSTRESCRISKRRSSRTARMTEAAHHLPLRHSARRRLAVPTSSARPPRMARSGRPACRPPRMWRVATPREAPAGLEMAHGYALPTVVLDLHTTWSTDSVW